MPRTLLQKIISVCVDIERAAQELYLRFAHNTRSESLTAFWQSMSDDERKHHEFWLRLQASAQNADLPNLFHNPDKVITDLEKLQVKVRSILNSAVRPSDIHSDFLVAYHLEFYLVHPVFAALFMMLSKITGDALPENSYTEHINNFITMLRTIHYDTPEFELFAEFVHCMWLYNRQTALQIGKVKTMEGLVPVCPNCKKVIDYRGKWKTIEYFLRKDFGGSFTHWICPECSYDLYESRRT